MLTRAAALSAALLFAAGVAGCAPTRHYVQIAEGLTSASITEGIRVAPRMFSAPQLIEACRTAVPIARLKVEPSTLILTQGNLYQLSSITVVAVNAADIAVPAIPIVVEAEDTNPPVLGLRSDDPDLDEGRIRVVGPGKFRVRIRTTCGMPQSETVVEAVAGS